MRRELEQWVHLWVLNSMMKKADPQNSIQRQKRTDISERNCNKFLSSRCKTATNPPPGNMAESFHDAIVVSNATRAENSSKASNFLKAERAPPFQLLTFSDIWKTIAVSLFSSIKDVRQSIQLLLYQCRFQLMKKGINRKERTGSKDWLSTTLHSPDIKHSKHIVTIMKHTRTDKRLTSI
jgi:hypothetical protein